MQKIEIGEYVRTSNGIIFEVVKIKHNKVYKTYINKDSFSYCLKEDIEKHSKNIIDLIEVGDYVNKECVTKITKNYITIGRITYGIRELKGIKSIVTHEQFESIEYKI